jgi:hypothetical protein
MIRLRLVRLVLKSKYYYKADKEFAKAGTGIFASFSEKEDLTNIKLLF